MTRIPHDGAAARLTEIIRGESNGMAHYYVAVDGADEKRILALAEEIARDVSGFLIPTDGFLLPARNLTPERAATPGGAFDYERFTREVARPFLSKKLPTYGVYREEVRGTVERVTVPERGVYLVAGRYALHPEIPDFYDLRIVLHGDAEDGDPVRAYLSSYMIEEFSDLVVTDGAAGEEEDERFDGFSLPLSFDGNA
ncbi:MAG: hypothetical protein J6Z04_04130 [Clostridia bacterium]|nr:hypothetical protein [Clostridia bacterium]